MPTEFNFINELMVVMQKGAMTPKVQVERIAGPIFTVFIEEVVQKLLESDPALSGEVRLVAPEFPLKKQGKNSDSTNIDWLLVNPGQKALMLVELKTDTRSFSGPQLDIYNTVVARIADNGGKALTDDLDLIRKATKLKRKYDFLHDEMVAPLKQEIVSATNGHILYFVPEETPPGIIPQHPNLRVYTFSQLPSEIPGPKNETWQVFRNTLCGLTYSNNRNSVSSSGRHQSLEHKPSAEPSLEASSMATRNWMSLHGQSGRTPQLIWFGKTGNGTKPNFQIQFNDGEILCYHYNGKPFEGIGPKGFKTSRIIGPLDFWYLYNK